MFLNADPPYALFDPSKEMACWYKYARETVVSVVVVCRNWRGISDVHGSVVCRPDPTPTDPTRPDPNWSDPTDPNWSDPTDPNWSDPTDPNWSDPYLPTRRLIKIVQLFWEIAVKNKIYLVAKSFQKTRVGGLPTRPVRRPDPCTSLRGTKETFPQCFYRFWQPPERQTYT